MSTIPENQRCHYIKPHEDAQCTAEAVDPDGEILLCQRHLGHALEMVKRRMATVKLAKQSRRSA